MEGKQRYEDKRVGGQGVGGKRGTETQWVEGKRGMEMQGLDGIRGMETQSAGQQKSDVQREVIYVKQPVGITKVWSQK